MEQENKELLLKDLSARLPYGVIVELDEKFGFNKGTHVLVKELLDSYCVEGIKPYLRSLSSMTEEEEIEFEKIFELELKALESPEGHTIESAASSVFAIDFYNKYHFDYRGLIEKGLAIAVTEENNPYKE